jgi:alkanesulfonate monooxygenase SsuD/methylene tetrahydromethanopterin reductase-like flavin-dependent oxidoreductase (luciferase family)
MKLGLHVLQDGLSYNEIRNLALKAEESGYNSFWILDHLHASPKPEKKFLECWTVLAALSSETKKIRLGALVLNINNRNPALLAKMVSTLDEISNGRVEVGIGAGGTNRAERQKVLGYEYEFHAYGIPFPLNPGIRIEKLEEGLIIMKKMWTQNFSSFQGDYYSINNAVCEPLPIQKPHPPIWIGGMKGKKMLKVIAKYADGWNIMRASTITDYKDAQEKLGKICKKIDRDITNIQLSLKPDINLQNYKEIFAEFESEGLDLAIVRAPRGREMEYVQNIQWN